MLLKRALGERLEASKYKQAGRDWVLEVYDTYGLAVTRHALEESLPAWTASLRRPKPDGSKGIERPGFQLVSMLEKRKDVDCPLERVFKDRGVEILEACGVELEDPFAEVREEARGKEEEGYRAWLEGMSLERVVAYTNSILARFGRPPLDPDLDDKEHVIGLGRAMEAGKWGSCPPSFDQTRVLAYAVYEEHLRRQREGERWAALPSAAERMAGMIQASSEAKRRGITVPRTQAQEATQ